MINNYDYKISIDTFDVGPKNRIRLSSILKYQEEAGEKHLATEFGLDYNTIRERGVVFVITNAKTVIHRMPLLKENITISTWNQLLKGLKFVRNTVWFDENNNKIVESSAVCVLVDAEQHKLVRPEALGYDLPQSPQRTVCFPMPKKIKMPENLAKLGEKIVYYSLLDNNDHLNNSFYADYLVDFVPCDDANKICGFSIDFVKEALLGDNIEVFTQKQDNYYFVEGKIGEIVCFRGKIEIK